MPPLRPWGRPPLLPSTSWDPLCARRAQTPAPWSLIRVPGLSPYAPNSWTRCVPADVHCPSWSLNRRWASAPVLWGLWPPPRDPRGCSAEHPSPPSLVLDLVILPGLMVTHGDCRQRIPGRLMDRGAEAPPRSPACLGSLPGPGTGDPEACLPAWPCPGSYLGVEEQRGRPQVLLLQDSHGVCHLPLLYPAGRQHRGLRTPPGCLVLGRAGAHVPHQPGAGPRLQCAPDGGGCRHRAHLTASRPPARMLAALPPHAPHHHARFRTPAGLPGVHHPPSGRPGASCGCHMGSTEKLTMAAGEDYSRIFSRCW